MFKLTLKNFGQSNSNLENFLESTGDEQLDDAALLTVNASAGVLAGDLKNLETHLVDLESQLEKLNPQTEVGKVL